MDHFAEIHGSLNIEQAKILHWFLGNAKMEIVFVLLSFISIIVFLLVDDAKK